MARKHPSIIDIVLDHDRQLEAIRAAELRRMNERAARGLLNNAAVLDRGAIENAFKGTRPVVGQPRQRGGRR